MSAVAFAFLGRSMGISVASISAVSRLLSCHKVFYLAKQSLGRCEIDCSILCSGLRLSQVYSLG